MVDGTAYLLGITRIPGTDSGFTPTIIAVNNWQETQERNEADFQVSVDSREPIHFQRSRNLARRGSGASNESPENNFRPPTPPGRR